MRQVILPQLPQKNTTEELARYINALHKEIYMLNFELAKVKGLTGSFTNGDGDTVTVEDGLIKNITAAP